MRIQEWMQCARKIAHTDFWSAYQHKRGLLKLNPWAEINIYPCDYCGGLHVGNQLTVLQAKRSLRTLERMMSHENFEVEAPSEVKEHLKSRKYSLEQFIKHELE